jgi:S-ribosylhomocysteine lyase LuxS involved in autoinducer biosynthesis
MLTKYKTVQEALVKSAGDIKTKVEALIKKNNWSNLTVVDLSPNPCNISFSEVIYGVAGAKSTKSVVNTVAETMNATNTSQVDSTTSTLKSTGWTSATYYDLTKDGSDTSVTLGADTDSTNSSS